MREIESRFGRVSATVKAFTIALLAVCAVAVVGTSSAQGAQNLTLTFNDSWIKVDALEELGASSFHALDPAAEPATTMALSGALANDGAFTSPKEAFAFPDQVIPEPIPGLGDITLKITAADNIVGNYNKDTGAFNATMPLTLQVLSSFLSCEISPLTIPIATSGTKNFGSVEEPNNLAGAPFAGGNGSALGSWTGVTVDSVKDLPPTPPGSCAGLIAGLLGDDVENPSFDGSIWLKGTSAVTGEPDPTTCPAGQTGTPPNCVAVTPFKVSKVVVSPKKGKVKAGKSIKLKVAVTNSGGTAGSAKVTLKSTNKQVKVPKSVKISVPAGKTVTKTITVKAGKKAKGKATISAKSGAASGKSVLTVKK